jgi:hypothetical protein
MSWKKVCWVVIYTLTAVGLAHGAKLAAAQGDLVITISMLLGAAFWIVGAFHDDRF